MSSHSWGCCSREGAAAGGAGVPEAARAGRMALRAVTGGGYHRSGPFESPNGGAAGGTPATAAGTLRPLLLCLVPARRPQLSPRPPLHLSPRWWGTEVAADPARSRLVRAPSPRRAGRGGGPRPLERPLTVWAFPCPGGCLLSICVFPHRVSIRAPRIIPSSLPFGLFPAGRPAAAIGCG